MVHVILNADDFGLTDAICFSINKLFVEGRISNTTAMVCVEGGIERLCAYRTSEYIGRVGLHLQLSSGKPILDPKSVPSLVCSDGRFKPKEAFSEMLPEEVYSEWRAQLKKFIEVTGKMPTHIDSHHGPHRQPHIKSCYFNLAAENKLSARGADPIYREEARSFGVKTADESVSGWTVKGESCDDLVKRILEKAENIGPDGYVEVALHPGVNDQDLRNVSSLTALRENDIAVLSELSSRNLLERHGLILACHPLQ